MSPEQSKQALRNKPRAAAEARYRQALQTLALREAAFLALDAIDAGAAAKLEALDARQAAAGKVAQARREVINAAWADGTLVTVQHLRDTVRAVLADAARPLGASGLAAPPSVA
ncbi:MAG: hypothetical protein EPN61_17535 [Burkholderiaceae bacterium]|nr:MAG: hypothetical protein EPN61_17535 [Burkholderiaceae bacterium]